MGKWGALRGGLGRAVCRQMEGKGIARSEELRPFSLCRSHPRPSRNPRADPQGGPWGLHFPTGHHSCGKIIISGARALSQPCCPNCSPGRQGPKGV